MKKSQKSYAKTKTKRHGGFRGPCQRGIVYTQLIKGVAKVFILFVINGEKPGKHHGLCFTISRKRCFAWTISIRQSISHMHGSGIFQAGNHITYLTHGKRIKRHFKRTFGANFFDKKRCGGLHHQKLISGFDRAVKDANRCHHASELVKIGVQNQSFKRRVLVPFWRRNKIDDCLEKIVDPLTGFSRNAHGIISRNGKAVFNFSLYFIRMRRRQIYFVDGGNNV